MLGNMEDESDPVLLGLLSLLWRLPPQDTTQNVFSLCAMNNDRADLILQRVQRPSYLIYDSVDKKHFLGNDFNKSAGAYRSPWNHSDIRFFDRHGKEVDSDEKGPIKAAKAIRDLENYLNLEMERYCVQRYPNGFSSVFAWELPKQLGFGVAVHFQTNVEFAGEEYKSCRFTWDVTHVITHIIHSQTAPTRHALYRIKTTLYVNMTGTSDTFGTVDFGTRSIIDLDSSKHTGQADGSPDANSFHLENIMSLVADSELTLMNKLKEEAIPRTIQALAALRFLDERDAATHYKITQELNQKVVGAQTTATTPTSD